MMASKREEIKGALTDIRQSLLYAKQDVVKGEWPKVERWLEIAARDLDILRDTVVESQLGGDA